MSKDRELAQLQQQLGEKVSPEFFNTLYTDYEYYCGYIVCVCISCNPFFGVHGMHGRIHPN